MRHEGGTVAGHTFGKGQNIKRVITYGTFDIFHIGHLKILERARALGDELFVGVSSDEFNAIKGKRAFFSYQSRADIVASLRCVTHVFPEHTWEQKREDFGNYDADIFVMGSDWEGKFDEFADAVDVRYLPRTEGISSTDIKKQLQKIDEKSLVSVKDAIVFALNVLNDIK